MDVPIGGQVYCENELWGRSTQVVLDQSTNRVTHIIVKREGLQSAGRKVPIEWLEASTPSRLVLSCSRAELVKSEYVQGEYTSTGPSKTEPGQTGSAHGVLSVRQGAWVEACDRYAGLVDEFLMDPRTHLVTHVVLREVHLWGNRRIVVPVSEISRLEENYIRLKLVIDNIQGLGSVPTEQHSAANR